jgi:multiple sugar transport system permease protein
VATPAARFNDSVAAARPRSTAVGYLLLAPSLFGVAIFLMMVLLVLILL